MGNDKNTRKLPQTPARDKMVQRDDVELAKEVSQEYRFERKPGFPPTAVEKKK